MPHVRRSMLITVDADTDRVRRAARRRPRARTDGDAGFAGPIDGMPDTTAGLEAAVLSSDRPHRPTCASTRSSDVVVPFFTWFLRIQAWLGARRALPHAAARLEAALRPRRRRLRRSSRSRWSHRCRSPRSRRAGSAPWPRWPCSPTSAVRCSRRTATRSPAPSTGPTRPSGSPSRSRAAGVLVSLVAIALADRWGRRRLILVALVGACAANALDRARRRRSRCSRARSCFSRALVNTALIVAGIAAVEDAPEGARAFATGMFALALGAGFGLSVVLLPLADLGDYGWRISFALSAALVLLVPLIARHLKETHRYVRVATQRAQRGQRFRELVDSAYGFRFLLLGLAAFLTNVFSAPSSQLTNRYLTHAHDFTNSDVALFRTVTAGRARHHRGGARQPAGREPRPPTGDHHRPPRGDRRPGRVLPRRQRRSCSGSPR